MFDDFFVFKFFFFFWFWGLCEPAYCELWGSWHDFFFLSVCFDISAPIRTRPEIQCLPYAFFLLMWFYIQLYILPTSDNNSQDNIKQYLAHLIGIHKPDIPVIYTEINKDAFLKKGLYYYGPRPGKRSEAGRGAFYFSAYSDSYQVTTNY